MSSLESKELLSGIGDGEQSNKSVEDNPPPPYQEASSSLSSRQPPLRTLRVQYDEGISPNRLSVFETTNLGEGQQPLYWAKLHITKLISGGAHMEFFKTAPHDEDVGSAKFHKMGSPRVDLTFRDGSSTTMTVYTGATYSVMNFTCFSTGARGGRRLQWKRFGQGFTLICADPNDHDENKQLASIHFGGSSNPLGEIVIEDHELGRDGHWVEEIMISGLAYIHLLKFMGNYAGARSSIGVV